MKKIIVLLLVLWLGCAYVTEGIFDAYMQHYWGSFQDLAYQNRYEDAWSFLPFAVIAGPIGLAEVFCLSGAAHRGIAWNWPAGPYLGKGGGK